MMPVSGVWSCPTGPLSARLAGYSVGPPSRTEAEAQAWLDVVDVAGTVAAAGSDLTEGVGVRHQPSRPLHLSEAA